MVVLARGQGTWARPVTAGSCALCSLEFFHLLIRGRLGVRIIFPLDWTFSALSVSRVLLRLVRIRWCLCPALRKTTPPPSAWPSLAWFFTPQGYGAKCSGFGEWRRCSVRLLRCSKSSKCDIVSSFIYPSFAHKLAALFWGYSTAHVFWQ